MDELLLSDASYDSDEYSNELTSRVSASSEDTLAEIEGSYDSESDNDLFDYPQIENTDESIELGNNIVELSYGCKHYMRRCSLFASCCNRFYVCRRCHDEEHEMKDGHTLDRYTIQKVKCEKCGNEQIPSQYCTKCGICFGYYFCGICNLFDDIDKDYIHCDKCNICRVARGQNLVHCDKCEMCFVNDFEHKCINIDDCPICYDSIKTSTSGVNILKCGHKLHTKCYIELLKSDYKCPICKKSVADMSQMFQAMDQQINQQQMPEEYKDTKVDIYCYDCEKKNNVNLHFIAMKCPDCGSYNTTQ